MALEPSRFEQDTAVEAVGDGHYRATIGTDWSVMGGAPNGGYVLAVAARAMRDPVPHPDPVSVTAHFVTPTQPGPVDVEVEVVRSGRRHSTVAGRLLQDGQERVRLLGTFADLGARSGPAQVHRSGPPLPSVEDCIDVTTAARQVADAGGFQSPQILFRFDHRMPAEMVGWTFGQPTGRGEMGGHLRWEDGAPMDTLGLLVVADCYPPALFNLDGAPVGWVPTIELTVQIRKRPAPGYLAAWMTTTALTGDYLEEDGEMWDADGDLVALSRQLALAARPGA